MRADRLLWFLRFAKSRTKAQRWIEQGHIRLNGERLTRCNQTVAVHDVFTLPLGTEVAIIQVLDLPSRRGPPAEARACYQRLDDKAAFAQQGGEGSGRPYRKGDLPA